MSNMTLEIEAVVRKYKRSRLLEWESLRQSKSDNNDRVLLMTEIIDELEKILGYSVSIEPAKHGNSIEERLDAI